MSNKTNNQIELLCIGTELLLGNIVNGNARWLAEELARLGIPHFRQTVVGDNRERLMEVVLEASRRCRVLICTGGLGPTPDDLTTETLAAAFNAPLEERSEVLADIKAKLSARGRPMAANNCKQALLPAGATVLGNPLGTAPGMIWSPLENFSLLTFPGVPAEMQAMWEQTAVPWLQQQGLTSGIFRSRLLRFWGIAESSLAEQVAPFLEQQNPTVAPYAGRGEVKLRITAWADNGEAADALIAPVEQQLRQIGGSNYFGADGDSLASVVLACLRERGETLAVAESCTSGGVGAALGAVPGASDVFLGGVIAYANGIKQTLLGVPADTLANHGAVSEAVAIAMAEGVRQTTGADWGVAVTGIAGPAGGSASKPVGLVHFGVAGPEKSFSFVRLYGASRGREWIRGLSVGDALDQLRLALA
ncbi:competence/damage-inducible protein A [Synechococcus sp. UW140]|uniref:competence/damage-inducible protein A n=1 Tax=Synechococcus sp. UW140 TaxID=368503 RepID=UPI003137E14F